MPTLRQRLRARMTYATVLSALTLFVVLGGGAAYAGSQLAKSSVGAKQLKKSSVVAAKIKKGAVTTAKIAAGAVTGAKVKDGSITGENIAVAETGYSRVIAEAHGAGPMAAPETNRAVFPLEGASFVQAAGEDVLFYGSAELTLDESCKEERDAFVYILLDSPNPTDIDGESSKVVAYGSFELDENGPTVTRRVTLGQFEGGGARFQTTSPVSHALSAVVASECEAGSGASVANVKVDAVGVG